VGFSAAAAILCATSICREKKGASDSEIAAYEKRLNEISTEVGSMKASSFHSCTTRIMDSNGDGQISNADLQSRIILAANDALGGNGTISCADVHQGGLSDCGFVASMAETALRNSSIIANMFIVNGDGTYTVWFYYGSAPEYVTVDSYLPAGGDSLSYAHAGSSVSDTTNELWISLAEKAYAQAKEMTWFGNGTNDYSSLAYQYVYTELGHITGQSTVGITMTSGSTSLNTFAKAGAQGRRFA